MGPNFREILPILVQHEVRFIVIGGGAAVAHGSARLTYDVDVVYARDLEQALLEERQRGTSTGG
jgi:hypothetical protein